MTIVDTLKHNNKLEFKTEKNISKREHAHAKDNYISACTMYTIYHTSII